MDGFKGEAPVANEMARIIAPLNELVIKQKKKGWCLQVASGIKSEMKFDIRNEHDTVVLKAKEHSGWCHRQICGSCRGFKMQVEDPHGNKVLKYVRPFRCSTGGPCTCCCNQEMEAYSDDHLLGRVRVIIPNK